MALTPALRIAAALALAGMAVAAAGVAAHPESAAPGLRPDVLAAWHEPETPEPHTQWTGYLRLSPQSNVTAAAFQVCRVGQACFAPPAPAQYLGNGTWAFDTADYKVGGRPVDYGAGWRLGVKWWLTEMTAEGTAVVDFPHGPDPTSPECEGEAAMACAEAHYLAFDVGKGSTSDAPLPALLPLAALLLASLAAAWARNRR